VIDDASLASEERERRIQRERRLQTWLISISTTVLVAGGGWALTRLIKIDSIDERVGKIEASTSGMYSKSDARRDFAEVSRRIGEVEETNREQERKIEEVTALSIRLDASRKVQGRVR
jgi:hypothetical protein